ncbi:MAG: ABC transporter ATP-binding protein [Gaiellaceae bacterium]
MLLELEAVDAFYGDFQALFGVSLAVAEGEVLAIIGANGAGKSTLLGSVAGVVQPRAGAVRLDGVPLARLPAHRRVRLGIALVPEGRRIFPSLTVDENLRVGAQVRRSGPWTRERIYDVFPMLAPLAGRQGAVLSGGEQQAVAIGRALMSNPRLLLLDELSLGLAPIVIDALYSCIGEIAGEGTTVVLVEQDVGRALATAARAYCLLEGRVSLHGATAELTRERVVDAYFGGASWSG